MKKKKVSLDVELFQFFVKFMGPLVLIFIVAAGIDIAKLFN